MRNQRILCCFIWLFVCLPGCGDSGPDQALFHDNQIIDSWMPNRERADGISFLQNGGAYESLEIVDDVDIDRDHVLPLLLKLRTDFDLNPQVLLDDPQTAFAVVIDVSTHQDQRSGIVDAIQEADDRFPGLILDKWGARWLSLDFLDTDESSMLAEAGELELLEQRVKEEREAVRSGAR